MAERDLFEKYREECIYRITTDHSLTGSQVRLGVVIAMYLNRKTREAWPSEERLTQLTGLHRRHLDREFEGLKHLVEVIPGKRGRGHTTHYRFRPVVAEPAVPHDAGEYFAYAKAWITSTKYQHEIIDRWKAERELRQRCRVVGKYFEQLRDIIDQAVPPQDDEIPL